MKGAATRVYYVHRTTPRNVIPGCNIQFTQETIYNLGEYNRMQ